VSHRQWVVNASPIILLGDIDQLQLLEALCDTLVVPIAVVDEILAGLHKDEAQHWIQGRGSSYIHEQPTMDSAIVGWDFGAGETAVLTWARQHPEYEAILDDRAARDCATTLNIPVRGTLGVILTAKREGLVLQVRPLFNALVDAGLRISPEVLYMALHLAEETL
jgi:predicted nucleic acid-binding protein